MSPFRAAESKISMDELNRNNQNDFDVRIFPNIQKNEFLMPHMGNRRHHANLYGNGNGHSAIIDDANNGISIESNGQNPKDFPKNNGQVGAIPPTGPNLWNTNPAPLPQPKSDGQWENHPIISNRYPWKLSTSDKLLLGLGIP